MAFDIGTTYLYGVSAGSANRESVMAMVTNIDPFDTPFLTMAPKVPAKHTTEEWLTDTLAATSTAGRPEGQPFAADSLNAPSRTLNVTQIFGKHVVVSETQQVVSPYGFADTFLYEIVKGTRETMRNIESRALGATTGQSALGSVVVATATGSGVTARVMKNLADFLTTTKLRAGSTRLGGTGTGASAQQLDEGQFNAALELVYNQGGNPGFVFVSGAVKRKFSGYAGSVAGAGGAAPTVYVAATDRAVGRAINSYVSDFGLINVVLDRWMPQATNTATDNIIRTGNVFILELPRCQIAFLRPLRFRRLAADGDRVRGMVVGELTIRVLTGKGSARIWGVQNRLYA